MRLRQTGLCFRHVNEFPPGNNTSASGERLPELVSPSGQGRFDAFCLRPRARLLWPRKRQIVEYFALLPKTQERMHQDNETVEASNKPCS